jgi:glutathione S-transferase
MKLFYPTSSPYARKLRVAAREKILMSPITEIASNHFADPPDLCRLNRIDKVLTLALS